MQKESSSRVSVGRILSEAFALYRARFRAVMVPMLAIYLPIVLLLFGSVAFLLVGVLQAGGAIAPYRMASMLIGFYGVYFLALVALVLLGYPSLYAQHAALLFPGTTGLRALKFAFSRYGHVLGLVLLTGVIVGGAVMAAYVPMVVGMVSLGVVSSWLSFSGGVGGPVIGVVVVSLLFCVWMMAAALAAASATGLAIPASAKLGLTIGKALRYSLSRCGRILVPLALSAGLYLLAVLVVNALFLIPLVAMGYAGATGEAVVVLVCLWWLCMLAMMVFGTPYQVAMQCVAFRLAGAQEDTGLAAEQGEA